MSQLVPDSSALPVRERPGIGRIGASLRERPSLGRISAYFRESPSLGRVGSYLSERRALGRVSSYVRQQFNGGPRGWGVLAAWVGLVFTAVVTADVLIGTPRPDQIRSLIHMPEATQVYDINKKLTFTIFKERRLPVPLSEVSPNVIQAVLAIEDQRFYQHLGIDPWRIGGALVANIRNGEKVQGASTITQQLARKSFLTDDKTFRRKLKEMFLAARIESHFTKDQILELYLNKVYFGNGYYGIEAAAQGYFSKPAKTLAVEEAALLAGLIKAPSSYAPTVHPERAIARRAVVLRQMAAAGFVDEPAIAKLENAPLRLADGFEHERSGQYFKNHIMRLLVDRFGWERLSQGGLRVYATIDADAQEAAEKAVSQGLDAIEKMPGFKHPKRGDPRTIREGQKPTYLQGALVAIDPRNGEVRAMTGGRDFDESQFNRAIQAKRQAGSAFKPFVYAAAMEAGYTPATLLTDLDSPIALPDGAWLPEDAHSKASSMTVRTALRTSSNRAAVRMLREVGISRAVTYAHRLGLDAPPVPSLVLGAGDVTALSMASAFGTFANGGLLRTPVFIRRVEDSEGRVIFSQEPPQPSRAVSEETAFLMAQILADVVNFGTGSRARQAGFRYPAAGKTGTTNEYRDAWFIGFTPALVASVWVGFDQPKTIMPGGYAGGLAAPIWGRFMQAAGNKDAGWIRRPDGIVSLEICRVGGGLPTEGCRRAISFSDTGEMTEESHVGVEYFRRGTEPTDECPVHGTGLIDRIRTLIGIGGEAPAISGPSSSAPAPRLAAPPPVAATARVGGTPKAATPAAAPAASAAPPTATPEKPKSLLGAFKRIFSKDPAKAKKPPSGRGGGGALN